MKPIVNGLEDKYGKEFDIVWIDIDTSRGKQMARQHAFIGQPTFIMFDSLREEARRLMGAQSRELLESEIERILGK